MKRIISLLLALVLVVGMLPLSVFAAELAITQQPKSIKVLEGQTAKVTLKATGDDLTYKWYYKNPGETKYSYTSSFKSNSYSITMNEARNGRYVYCKVYDGDGNYVKSNTVSLRMAEPVKITAQPKNVSVANGESAKVSVTASGDGLTYQWYVKNPGKTTFSKSSITKSTYSVTMKDTVSGRQVYCIVTDKYGASEKSSTVTLSMASSVKITTQPTNATVAKGESTKVSVVASGEGLTYQWYVKNAGKTTFSKSSVAKNVYSVTMTDSVNGRQVYCIVTDKNGVSVRSNTVTLSMASGVKIIQEPVSVRVAEGEKAIVTVKATGEGLTYKWYYKNPGETEYSCTSSFTGSSYSITMNAERNGRYVYCKVSDKYGNTVKSKTVSLRMEETGFRITTQPKSYTELDIESTTTYHVAAAGGKEPYSYQWQYAEIDDAELDADGKYVYSWSEYEDIPAPNDDNWSGESTDTFTWVQSWNYTDYTLDVIKFRCRVTDADGNTVYSKDATHQLRFYIWQDPDIWYDYGYYHVVDSDVCGGTQPYIFQWQYTNDSLKGTYKPVTPELEWVFLKDYSGAGTPEEQVSRSQLEIDKDDTAMFAREGYRFRYTVTDADGRKLTSESVGFKLMILEEPENVESFDGDQASFHVEASGGKAPYTYQWQYICDGQDYKNLTDSYTWLSGETTDTLTVNVSETHFRYHNAYRCIVTDAEGNQVTTKEVRAYKPLTITVQPADVIASVGDEARFTVEVEGGCGKLYYYWYYNGSSDTGWMANDSNYSNYYTQTLTVSSVEEKDLGRKFYVTVKDQEGNKVTSDRGRIYAPLAVKTQPEDMYTNAGEWITFTAEAQYGKEPYTYKWQYISDNSSTPKDFTGTATWHSGSDTDTLSIKVYQSDIDHKWQYRCIITDANGQSVTTDYASLYQGLSVTEQPENIYFAYQPGNTGSIQWHTISVTAAGGKAPYTYQWYQSSDVIGKRESATTQSMNSPIYSNSADNNLRFYCVITDAAGNTVTSDEAWVYNELRIATQPKDQTGALNDTVTFTVAPTGGKGPYTYKWEFKAEFGSAWQETGSNSATLTKTVSSSLMVDYYYMYRCTVTDSLGNTVTSEIAYLNK